MPLRKWPVASTSPRTGVAPSTGRWSSVNGRKFDHDPVTGASDSAGTSVRASARIAARPPTVTSLRKPAISTVLPAITVPSRRGTR